MKQEFIDLIINEIENSAREKRIDAELVKNFLVDAIKKTYQKKFDVKNLNFDIDLNNRKLKSEIEFDVVDKNKNDYDDFIEIPENDKEIKKLNLKVGDKYYREFDIQKEFSRGEVQQIIQTFKQKMIEVTNQQVYSSWKSKVNQIVYAEFEKDDRKSGAYYVDLKGIENVVETTGYLPKKEQNPRERLILGNKYPFVVKEVTEQSKFWPVVLSRASEELIKYYMTLEIPEIDQDLIKITKVARTAGVKSKVLVKPNSKSMTEPVAICIGNKGMRIKSISNLIGQEKIEVFLDYEDPIKNLINLFGRDKLLGINIQYDDENKIRSTIVFVKDEDVSVILGKFGVNVKLINKLLNFSIDVKTLDYARENGIEYTPIAEFPELNENQFESFNVNTESLEENLESNDYSMDMDELINSEDEYSEEFINDLFNDDISKLIEDENKK